MILKSASLRRHDPRQVQRVFLTAVSGTKSQTPSNGKKVLYLRNLGKEKLC
jgi:hypothetical protein